MKKRPGYEKYKEEIISLYKEGLSGKQISEKLPLSCDLIWEGLRVWGLMKSRRDKIREEIVYSDPEAWRMTNKDGYENKEIVKTSETARFFTVRRIGSILSELGFDQKRRGGSSGNYQRKATIKKIKEKANTLNIQIDDIEKEKTKKKDFFNV